MSLSFRTVSISFCLSSVIVLTTGCALSNFSSGSASSAAQSTLSGKVHGGQQPVSGATIQLYAVNTATNAGPSTPLLTNPVTTAADGTFSITADYTCPATNPLVYIVATGGNPGLPGTVNNTGIAMMSMIGTCNTLTASPSTTFIYIDELTTVVSVQVLAPFMTDYAHVGSAPSSLTGVAGAFSTASGEINYTNGQLSNSTGAVAFPLVSINTMADIIAACINTSPGSTPCSTLFSNTGGATDTIGAALAMAQSPGQNTTPLYALITSTSPFQPYFTTAPTDFTSTIGYTLPTNVQAGTLDSNGQIWLYFGGYTYNTVTDISTNTPGYINVYDNSFNKLFTITQPASGSGPGGLYFPSTLSPDASGHVFAINENNTISEFDTNGNALSPAAGWSNGYSAPGPTSGTGNGYVSTDQGPLLVDALGNIWGAAPSTAPFGSCYYELNSSGTVITPTLSATSGTFCTQTGISNPEHAAVDGQGNAWVLGSSTIAKVNAQGTLAATAPTTQGCFYPSSNLASATNFVTAYETLTNGLVYDNVNNQLWAYSQTGAGAITDAGANNFCDFGPTVLPVQQQTTSTSTIPGSAFSGSSLLINNAILDGAGNLWFSTSGITATGVVGFVPSSFTGTATYASYLGEISPSGKLLTPYNPSTQTYGLQPTGFGPNGSAAASNAVLTESDAIVDLLGVDRFGNIWALDAQTDKLLKITGLAVANTKNY